MPAGAWDNPAPCEGWVARDIVAHLVGWMPAILGTVEKAPAAAPSVEGDPLAAWTAVNEAIQACLDDPEVAEIEFGPGGPTPFERAVGMFGTGDVLVHTWDLARAAGLDEQLDPDEVHRLFEAMEPMDAMIRGEHFGPRVAVPDDADEQTKLIAFTGRTR